MSTRIEFYQRLREHIPEEAARMIAEEMPDDGAWATKQDVTLVREDVARLGHGLTLEIERLRSSLFRWQLTFFVPLWLGVYGTLVAILVRGS